MDDYGEISPGFSSINIYISFLQMYNFSLDYFPKNPIAGARRSDIQYVITDLTVCILNKGEAVRK
jgi:hypothetical protein